MYVYRYSSAYLCLHKCLCKALLYILRIRHPFKKKPLIGCLKASAERIAESDDLHEAARDARGAGDSSQDFCGNAREPCSECILLLLVLWSLFKLRMYIHI